MSSTFKLRVHCNLDTTDWLQIVINVYMYRRNSEGPSQSRNLVGGRDVLKSPFLPSKFRFANIMMGGLRPGTLDLNLSKYGTWAWRASKEGEEAC
jgi:hypothetical protein